jgi:predicted DNA-binding transcriptional regulator YafY
MSIKASQISFNEGLLRLAMIHGREVEFRYEKNPGASIQERRLWPSSITETKDEHTVFVGDDPDRNGVRSYRVDRVRGDVRVV